MLRALRRKQLLQSAVLLSMIPLPNKNLVSSIAPQKSFVPSLHRAWPKRLLLEMWYRNFLGKYSTCFLYRKQVLFSRILIDTYFYPSMPLKKPQTVHSCYLYAAAAQNTIFAFKVYAVKKCVSS